MWLYIEYWKRLFRDRINPKSKLPEIDVDYIGDKIARRVRAELATRINRGYEEDNLFKCHAFSRYIYHFKRDRDQT